MGADLSTRIGHNQANYLSYTSAGRMLAAARPLWLLPQDSEFDARPHALLPQRLGFRI